MVAVRHDTRALSDAERTYALDRLRIWAGLTTRVVVSIGRVRLEETDLVYKGEDDLAATDPAAALASIEPLRDAVDAILSALVALEAAGTFHGGVSLAAIAFRKTAAILAPPDLAALSRTRRTGPTDLQGLAAAFPQLALPFDPATATARDALAAFRATLYIAGPVERDFLAALRAAPADATTRSVYADWLEQHGLPRRAAFVRDGKVPTAPRGTPPPTIPASESRWRTLVARVPVVACSARPGNTCTQHWDTLAATADDDAHRTCATCNHTIEYVVTYDAAIACGRRGDPMAVDESFPVRNALNAHTPPMSAPNPPAPR